MWGEGCCLFDMKCCNESLDRIYVINYSVIVLKEVFVGSKLFIY